MERTSVDTTGSSLFRLDGRVAIVTGGTRGLGRAIAEGFVSVGAKVVITGRRQPECDAAAEQLGPGVIGVPAHAGDPASHEHVVNVTVEAFGGLDIVVNNAAISLGMEVGEITTAALQKSLDVNLVGPLLLVQAALPHLQRRDAPCVINVTTAGLERVSPGLSVYFAAKAGLDALTRTMALDLARRNVRVNAISPGPFATDMVLNMDPAQREAAIAKTPLGRMADPCEIAGAAIFLASAASSFVTGATLVVDGGMTI